MDFLVLHLQLLYLLRFHIEEENAQILALKSPLLVLFLNRFRPVFRREVVARCHQGLYFVIKQPIYELLEFQAQDLVGMLRVQLGVISEHHQIVFILFQSHVL